MGGGIVALQTLTACVSPAHGQDEVVLVFGVDEEVVHLRWFASASEYVVWLVGDVASPADEPVGRT